MMLRTRISMDKKPTLQVLTFRKVVPVAFMCEPCRLISRLTNEQKQAAPRAPVQAVARSGGATAVKRA